MLSLYLHIPFCAGKCSYCGFYSTPYEATLADAFLGAMSGELGMFRSLLAGRTVGTVYIGGGTPTTLSREQIARLFRLLRQEVAFDADAEVTVEANPNTITSAMADELRRAGVTRLSIGVQSFSDDVLSALGRPHASRDALQAVAAARESGFDNIGIDLIYGVPGQQNADWKGTLRTAINLRPEHLSVYGLSADEGSRLKGLVAAGTVTLPDDDLVAEMYLDAVATLEGAGYHHYEVSNFSRPGRECRHNLNYWERGEYLGLGPSAWSFLGGRRWRNVADLRKYRERIAGGGDAIESMETTGPDRELTETLLLRLRTASGVDLAWFGGRFGAAALEGLRSRAARLPSEVAVLEHGRLRLTARGMMLSNEAIGRLLP